MNNCNNCQNCQNCKLLVKKLELYEKFFNDMKEIDNQLFENSELGKSIIIKDNYGNKTTKIKSNLSESILVVNNGKNLDELNITERQSIEEQDNLYNYNKTKEYFNKASGVVSWGTTIVKWGKWLLF